MVQAMTMMRNLLWSDTDYEKVGDATEATYRTIHDKVAIELGKEHLSAPTYQVGYTTYKVKHPNMIRTFLLLDFPQGGNADTFFKDLLSLIEQAFRHKWEAVQSSNAAMSGEIAKAAVRDKTKGSPYISKAPAPFTPLGRVGSTMPAINKAIDSINKTASKQATSFYQDLIKTTNAALNGKWEAAVEELNERLRINGYNLHFHNGLLQVATDDLIEAEVHEPFWDLVSNPLFRA